ncbi:MAG: hypothetical protein Q4B09_08640 [Lachnospiraceae bacterium]|nr:hypothetical protein [Lachnospiraceae bacterium]
MYFCELLDIAPELSGVVSSIPADLDGQFTLHRYEAHSYIHQKNTPLTRIGILLEGSFRVVNELENGNVFMIEVNDAISFIGEDRLLSMQKGKIVMSAEELERADAALAVFITQNRNGARN